MARRSGFTLIEALLALAVTMIVTLSFSTLLKGITKLSIPDNQDDLAYAIYAISEEVNMANQVIVEDDILTLETLNQTYAFYIDDKRLVRTPGFNIYLHHVDRVFFTKENDDVYMTLKRGDTIERYQIGTAYRPQKRLCEPDSTIDVDDTDDISPSVDTNDFNRSEFDEKREGTD